MNTPTTLSPGLQALLTLQQTANPTTPQGGPTIAAKAAADAAQKTQMAPQGIAGMQGQPQGQPQGIATAVNQAQAAAPSVAQNAQNAQMGQMAQKVAQLMQSQQGQSQGVAGLPANNMRGFKEGGIIGFDGEERSDVPLPDDMRPWSRFPAGSLIEGFSNPVQRTRGGKYLYNGEIYPDKESAERVAIATYQGKKPFVPNAEGVPRDTGSRPGAFEANFSPTGIAAAIPASANPAALAAGATGAGTAPTQQRALSAGPRTPAAPEKSDPYKELLEYSKPGPESPDQIKYREAVEEQYKLRQAQPPVQQTALAALQRAIQEREEQQQNINSQAGSRRLDAYLAGAQRGRGRGGEAVANFRDTEESRKAEYIQRKLLDATAQSAMEDAQRAQAAGNQGAYVEALGKLAAARNEQEKTRVQNVGNVLQAATQIRTGAANNATQLQVAQIQAAVGHAHNDILRGAQGTKEQLAAIQVEKLVEADPALKTLAAQTIDPKSIPKYNEYRNSLILQAYKRVAPDIYEDMVKRGVFNPTSNSTAGNPPQGAVRPR